MFPGRGALRRLGGVVLRRAGAPVTFKETGIPDLRSGTARRTASGTRRSYCTLSATKRSSPSPFETSSSTDFLPSFFN